MDTTTTTPEVAESAPARAAQRRAVVIADGGNEAWVVVLSSSELARVGARFAFRGAIWEVKSFRPHVRAWVAEPVEQ